MYNSKVSEGFSSCRGFQKVSRKFQRTPYLTYKHASLVKPSLNIVIIIVICYVIYQTRERVFHKDIQTPRSGLKKRDAAEFFLTKFEVFGYLMKHSFEFLIWLLKPFIILGEIQSKSLQNFMLIKILFPSHRYGSDFLCFLFMNY